MITLEEACRRILGRDIADSIIADQGVKWAVVAAMAAAKNSDDREALEALDAEVLRTTGKLPRRRSFA